MQQEIETRIRLRHATIEVGTFYWQGIEEAPPGPGYRLSQRLSEDHSPLQLGNLAGPNVLPRLHSVGFLPPGKSVLLFPIEKPLRVQFCIFDEAYFEAQTGIPRNAWEELVDSMVMVRSSRLESVMQDIHREIQSAEHARDNMLQALSTIVEIELARYARNLQTGLLQDGAAQPLANWQVQRILERIHSSDDLGYPRLRELADLCGISEGHLARSFKKATGWQIKKFVAQERAGKARELLANSNKSCAQIAKDLGFNSSASFSTAFSAHEGVSPSQFRKQLLARNKSC